MAHYILQTIFFQLCFLLMYEFLLKKETFFNYNRWYLLLTPVLSLILPLLNFEVFQTVVPPETFVILPEVFIGENTATTETIATTSEEKASKINWRLLIYAAGVLVNCFLFLKKLLQLQQLSKASVVSEEKSFKIVEIPDSKAAFSFYNSIFLGENLSEAEKQHILQHELVHVRQKHSLDLLFFEVQKIIFWFNPLVYIFQHKISTVHEFLADAQTVKATEKQSYYQQLLNTAFGTREISFINQFFNHSLIKKRIVMLQKQKSKSISKFKYLLTLPLMLLMLTYVSNAQEVPPKMDKDAGLSTEDREIKEKFRIELKQSLKGGSIADYLNLIPNESDKSIKSKEAFYHGQVYLEHVTEETAERQKEEGNFDAEQYARLTAVLKKSYQDYLDSDKSKASETKYIVKSVSFSED